MKSSNILAVTLLSALTAVSIQASATDKYGVAPNYSVVNNIPVRQEQEQGQDQIQAQRQSQSNGQLLNSNNFNNPRQTATAMAPPVIVPECSNGASGGVQRPTFGISLGFTSQDGHCEMLADAAFLSSMGMLGTAKARMCQDKKIAKAMRDSGEWDCVEAE